MRARWLGLGVAMAVGLASGCLHRKPKVQGFEAVVVSQDVHLLEQTLGGAKARYAASILGPHDGATIDRVDWRVTYDGEEIAHGTETPNLPFDENGNAPLTLVLPVPYAKDAAALRALDGKKKVKLGIEGSFHFKHGLLYDANAAFRLVSDVTPPRLPRIKLARVDGARFSTGVSQVALTLEVTNPNPFPILLSEVPYSVGLGGQRASDGVALAGEPINGNGSVTYPVQAYLDPPSEDPDDWPRRTKVEYWLKGAVRGALFDVRFAFDGTAKLRSGG